MHHLLRQGGRIDDQGILPTGFGDQGNIDAFGHGACGQVAVDQLRHFRRARENHAFHAHVIAQAGANDVAAAGQKLQRTARHARRMQQLHGAVGDQRRLLGRLGQHHVAGGQGGGQLARKDGQREIPRADAGNGAERQGVRRVFHLRRVVAQEVDGFADFRDRVWQGLARFAHGQGHQLDMVFFEQVGRAL